MKHMKSETFCYEYQYGSSNLSHAHGYLIPPLLDLLPSGNKCTHRVLDLGCGNGSLSSELVKQGYEVTGVEESESGVAIAQRNFTDCHFVQGSIYDLPYDQLFLPFDVVIAVEVIEHLFYPKELIRSAQKCLKSGGQLIITTPYHGYLKNLALSLSGAMEKHFTVLWDGGHIKFFSVKTLTQLLESEGFTDITFRFAGRLPYLWKSMICSAKLP